MTFIPSAPSRAGVRPPKLLPKQDMMSLVGGHEVETADPAGKPIAVLRISNDGAGFARLLAVIAGNQGPRPHHPWAWSKWGRHHQHRARVCHYHRRHAKYDEMLLSY